MDYCALCGFPADDHWANCPNAPCPPPCPGPTQRLGLETNFVAHDVRDLKPEDVGVTEDGLNTTHDAQVAAGVKESKGRFVF